MNNKVIKEALIIVLLFLVILFTIGILFYDCMSVDVDKVVSIEYETDENVNEVLNEIEANTGIDVKNTTSNSLLKSYSITADDLTVYASEKSYESGKKDPFAESSETIEEYVTTTLKKGTTTNPQTNNQVIPIEEKPEKTNENKVTSNVTNTVSRDKVENNTVSNSTKNTSTTGTFFEKQNSK